LAGEKILVIRSEDGEIVESKVVEGSFYSVLKDVTRALIDLWDAANSGFVVLRDYKVFEAPLPLDPEVYDLVRRYGSPTRSGGKALLTIPVYTISYDYREGAGEQYSERKLCVVTLYLNEAQREVLEEDAKLITSP